MTEASVAPKTHPGGGQPRLLRQLKSGHIYIWTETLAARPDMVPYDSETAKRRIATLKQIKEDALKRKEDPEEQARLALEMKEASQVAKELTELENQVDGLGEASSIEDKNIEAAKNPEPDKRKTDAEIEAARRSEIIEKDPHIQRIMSMRKKADVETYILTEYGEEVEPDAKLATMQNKAVQLRTERLFEGDEG